MAGIEHPWTVVSFGMLADIAAPLLLQPQLDLLIAIDNVDSEYLRSRYLPCGKPKDFAEVRRIIKHILTTGSDLALICGECLCKVTLPSYCHEVRALQGKATIVEETMVAEGVWQLDFCYRNKVRRLLFFQRDYVKESWPPHVRHVSAVLTVGSPFPAHSNGLLREWLQQRCLPECVVFASKITYEDEPEGWFLPALSPSEPVALMRGSDRINCFQFPLSKWLEVECARYCAQCRRVASKRCGRCKKVVYCSVDCQRTHYAVHSPVCR